MLSRFKDIATFGMLTLALLSLSGGPRLSAAYAACCDRLARDKKSGQKAGGAAQMNTGLTEPGSDAGPGSEEPERDEPPRASSMVAPNAAKPAGEHLIAKSLATTGAQGCNVLSRSPHPAGLHDTAIVCRPLHRPAYQAHAPPALSLHFDAQ